MKKITILAMLLLAGYAGQAQYSYEAVDDYGKLSTITYDLLVENKIYAATQTNHIVVSYDNGETWDLQYAFPDTVGQIKNLIALPGGENLCFSVSNVATAENIIHILNIADNEIISTFGLPEGEGDSYISGYNIYDSEATTILLNLSTSEGHKVYYTTTSGENWTLVYNAQNYNNVAIQSVAISPGNPSKLFLTRGHSPSDVDGGIFISTNAGETWTEKLPGIVLNPIDFKSNNPNDIMVGTDMFIDTPENLYRSLDGGETWNAIPIAWTDFVLDHIIMIKYHPQDPDVIFVLEENEIVYTEDGGTTWQTTAYEEDEYYAGLWITVNPFEKEAIISTDSYPSRTVDGGATLTQVKAPFYNVTDVTASKFGASEHLYYNAQGGYQHKNYATGISASYETQPISTFSPREYRIVADPYTEGRVFLYTGSGMMGYNLYLSNDHGATSTPILNDFAPYLTDVVVDPDNHNSIYVLLDNWGMGSLLKLNIADPDNVTSEPVVTPGDDASFGGLIAYSNKLVLSKANKLYTSTDEGATWTELYALPENTTVADLTANPLNNAAFALASSNGVYATADNGATFTLSHEGIDTRKVEFSDVTDGIMAVGVYNSIGINDAHISYFNGSGWVTVSSQEMNYIQSYAMDFNFSGDNINAYIGTVDMGVIRYSFPISTAGIDNPVAQKTAVFAAPNPASEIVTIHTTGNSAIKSVEVYNITGQKVAQAAQPSVNVSHLSNGIYVVKAETISGAVTSVKLVKE